MEIDTRTIELIAIGASITAGCQPCLRYHVGKAKDTGATDGEIADAIAVGQKVRGGGAKEMDKFAEQLAGTRATCDKRDQAADSGGSACSGEFS
ncbi:MAG: carboxymuconolactone decarboxylase family protein [Candidatus Geothermincolia bacterium]